MLEISKYEVENAQVINKDIGKATGKAYLMLIALSAISLVLTILFGWTIARAISKPLHRVATAVTEVAGGNLAGTLLNISSKDEIGTVAVALDKMVTNLRALIKQVSSSAEQVAASSEELTAGAQQSAEASNNIATSITQVAEGSSKQVSAVNDTSAIVEEISATMEEVSATATEMATLSEKTAKVALDGTTSVNKAVTQMGAVSVGAKQAQSAAVELKTSSAQIGEIVGLISAIAGQTNLLALNAAIEAARAGEQGRGFAVVAEEVRKLAEQSETAARQIKTLVGSNHESIDKVVGAIDIAISDISQGVELVNVAGENFGAINAQIRQVTDQVVIIAKAINEAAVGSQRIVSSIKEVETVSRDSAAEAQTVSAATEEQSASMEEIAASSQALAKLATDLQVAVSKFRV
jgi:methyl-accepting chemotaxis protein